MKKKVIVICNFVINVMYFQLTICYAVHLSNIPL